MDNIYPLIVKSDLNKMHWKLILVKKWPSTCKFSSMAASGQMDQQISSKNPLTAHDKEILTSIFNPSFPYEDEEVNKPKDLVENVTETEAIKAAKKLEIQGVEAAEKGDLEAALDFFNQAVETEPNWASSYNNRAQCYQLKMDTDRAFEDLNKAIELSEGKGKVACQAFTQRAMIKRVKASDEEALEDFKKAAALGSEFAKEQAVKLNPIAALCNAMMCEMIQNAKEGYQ